MMSFPHWNPFAHRGSSLLLINKERTVTINFLDQIIEIRCNSNDAYSLIDFLFGDLICDSDGLAKTQYDIICVGKQPMLSLWEGDKRFYFGTSQYRLAYILTNEIIYHCITENGQQHAIHAGAVCNERMGIILPGKSGSGKSSLSAWMISKGYQYLTDELVMLTDAGRIIPFTRPISLKSDQLQLFLPFLKDRLGEIVTDEHGSMIPHRLLNSGYSHLQPPVTHIIFPEFRRGSATEFQELSPAKSCLMLLESHVNGRNLSGLGIAGLAKIVRSCRSYSLVYGYFDGLERLFDSLLPC
jgi:hypothetical protein